MPKCMRCMGDYEMQAYCPHCGTPQDSSALDEGQLPAAAILKRRFIVGEPLRHDQIGFWYIAWDALLERRVFVREWFPPGLVLRGDDLKAEPDMDEGLWEDLCMEFIRQADRMHRRQDLKSWLPVYTYFEENNTSYYVTEYSAGNTLRDLLSRNNPLEPEAARSIAEKIRDSLEVLHQNGIIHGNISPDTVFFKESGDICFLDPAWFGGAMSQISHRIFWTRYTPERYRSVPLEVNREMDKFGVASVYYRMVTGEEPLGSLMGKKNIRLPDISEYGIRISSQEEKKVMNIIKKGTGNSRKRPGLFRF